MLLAHWLIAVMKFSYIFMTILASQNILFWGLFWPDICLALVYITKSHQTKIFKVPRVVIFDMINNDVPVYWKKALFFSAWNDRAKQVQYL